jgi:hypothetical protein
MVGSGRRCPRRAPTASGGSTRGLPPRSAVRSAGARQPTATTTEGPPHCSSGWGAAPLDVMDVKAGQTSAPPRRLSPSAQWSLGGIMAERYIEEDVEGDATPVGDMNKPRPGSATNPRGYVKRLSRWPGRLLGLLLLTPACVLAVLFWRVPVADPLTVSALLVDRTLMASTALVLPVCLLAMAVAPWEWAERGAVAGAMVAVALGGSISLAALRPPVDLWPTVLAVLALVGGIGLLIWRQGKLLLSWRGTIPIVGILSLLPLVQFWHATSFVPAHLNTTVGTDVKVTGQTMKGGSARGEIEVTVRNNGDIGALVLASELILCYWPEPHEFLLQDDLYNSEHCETEQIFSNLSEIDSHSTWTMRHAFQRAPKGSGIRVVQGVVLLWYARMDRLRIDNDPVIDSFPLSIMNPGRQRSLACRKWTLSVLRVQEESRFQGVVQRERRLVYLDSGDPGDAYFALTTVGESYCNSDGDESTKGLPRWSSYDIGQRVGVRESRLNHEQWLETTKGN